MPVPKRPGSKKKAAKKKAAAKTAKKAAAKPKPGPEVDGDAVYTDDHGIKILGDGVEVWVSCEAKMSRDYQSCGVQKGIKFKTPKEDYEQSIDRAMKVVRTAVKSEVDHIVGIIDHINDA